MILLGRTRESVLPTIVSRCQVVPFRHIPASEAAGIVAQNTGADPAQARQAIEACGGSITSAVAFLRAPGSERLAFRTRLFSDLAMLQRADDWDVVEMARALVEASKAPLDEVRASQEEELAENADFLAKSAIRQIEARNKRQLSAKTSEYLRQTTAMVRSWLRDGLMVACGSWSSTPMCAIRWSRCSPAPMRRSSPQLAPRWTSASVRWPIMYPQKRAWTRCCST